MRLNKLFKIINKPLILLAVAFYSLFIISTTLAASQLDITYGYPWSGAATPGSFVVRIYQIAMGLGAAAALMMMLYGAVIYSVSGGSPSRKSEGLGWIKSALWGLILLLAAYIILYTINHALVDVAGTQSFLDTTIQKQNVASFTMDQSAAAFEQLTGLPANTAGVGPDGIVDPGQVTHQFASNGIQVCENDSDPATCQTISQVIKSKPQCAQSSNGVGCVSFSGMKGATLNEILYISDMVGGANVFVTGGTEPGHAAGVYSHGNGYKFDLKLNQTLDNYITSKFKPAGIRSDGAALYRSPTGALYAHEGNHWDIAVVSAK